MEQEIKTPELENELDKKPTDDSEVDSQKTFTDDEVAKRIQSETDRVRTEYSKKIKKLEERISELEPKELSPAELEMAKRLEDLEKKQKLVDAKEELLNVQTRLSQLNLPKSLVTYLNGNVDLDALATEIDEIVTERNKKLGYQPSPHVNGDGMTHEKWKKLSYSQKVELYNKNPDLYSKFMK